MNNLLICLLLIVILIVILVNFRNDIKESFSEGPLQLHGMMQRKNVYVKHLLVLQRIGPRGEVGPKVQRLRYSI